MSNKREKLLSYLEEKSSLYIDISHQIHSRPEIGNQEHFASALLSDTLEKHGFTVNRGIAGYETGFIAQKSLGGGPGPNIALLCEYDALAGLGHACGHNLIGSASVAAALALTSQLAPCAGAIYVYGCPAEEGGVNNASSKAVYAREGLFAGMDAAMQIHASGINSVTTPHLAVDSWNIEFFGKPAHASSAPYEGINALDAMILFFSGIGLLRQQLKDDARLHGVILKGGDAPNIIPDYTLAKFYVRSATKQYCQTVSQKVENVANAAAIATGCTYQMQRYKIAVDNFLLCPELDKVYREQAESLGMVFTDDLAGMGSSDVGNVTQVVPTIQPYFKIAPENVAAHTVEFREAAASTQADIALIKGAQALALTALRLLEDPVLLENIKQAHAQRMMQVQLYDQP